jgi:hypothetical protein
MPERLTRFIEEPIRPEMSWEETWKGDDYGLIKCWEVGRKIQRKRPDLAEAALRGELPPLPWTGGVESELKIKSKWGAMNYLAMWQGIRSEDLNVPLDADQSITCSRTGITVTFTRNTAQLMNE